MTNFTKQWDAAAISLIKSKFFSLADKASKKDIDVSLSVNHAHSLMSILILKQHLHFSWRYESKEQAKEFLAAIEQIINKAENKEIST